MGGDHILSIDMGTQSARALLFDLKGNLITGARVPIEAYFSSQPGWAEQHAEYFWTAICQACQKLWSTTTLPRAAVGGVALTTQRSTVVNVDAQGKALRPAIVWLDQRRTDGLKPVGGLWGIGFSLAGMTETVAYLQSQAEGNWIQKHEPDVWKRTHKYLLLSGYLTYRLTGRFADSIGCQVGYMPFDYKAMRWASPRDWKWQALPMAAALLPDLVPSAGLLGEVTPQAAENTGIPAGTPVIAAAADKACEVLGCGCLEPDKGCLSYGSAATINTTHRKYVEVIPLLPPYPAAVPNRYSLEVQIYRGYWMVSWFRDEFAHREREIASKRGVEPEELFDDLVDQVPPGSMGLMLQPYWSPGLKVPGPEAKGAIIGFGDIHTRAHVYRAILEGLAYALREGKERTEKRSGVAVTELRVAGGGSRSGAAMQLTADIFGLPTARPHVSEASGLGAAIDTAVGIGLHEGFERAVSEMTRVGEVFEPDPQTREIYDGLYAEVYRRMYRQLRPLYERIRHITGYPPSLGRRR